MTYCEHCGKLEKVVTTNLNNAANKFAGKIMQLLAEMHRSAQNPEDERVFLKFKKELLDAVINITNKHIKIR